jgi:hypothetical protein
MYDRRIRWRIGQCKPCLSFRSAPTERNPNVYYELGIAHSFDKPTILIAQKIEDVPFDIQSKRILIYKKVEELRAPLTESLLQTVAAN